MAQGKAEQIGKVHSTSAAKKYAKKRLHKIRRQAEKKDIENAGRRNKDFIQGWTD